MAPVTLGIPQEHLQCIMEAQKTHVGDLHALISHVELVEDSHFLWWFHWSWGVAYADWQAGWNVLPIPIGIERYFNPCQYLLFMALLI